MKKAPRKEVYPGLFVDWIWSDFLKQYYAPAPHKMALEIAKIEGWDLWHVYDVAANYFGASTQLVAQYVFVSSGPSKIIELNYDSGYKNPSIEFLNKSEVGCLDGCGKIDLDKDCWSNFDELKEYFDKVKKQQERDRNEYI